MSGQYRKIGVKCGTSNARYVDVWCSDKLSSRLIILIVSLFGKPLFIKKVRRLKYSEKGIQIWDIPIL